MKLIDVVCPQGHITVDVFVKSLDLSDYPPCACLVTRSKRCGQPTNRAWLSAPSITPQGTRRERNTDKPATPRKVDVKAIAAETQFEVEQKWQRYSDPQIAEQHVGREINEAAGIADAAGNELPIPTPPPITFEKPALAACAR